MMLSCPEIQYREVSECGNMVVAGSSLAGGFFAASGVAAWPNAHCAAAIGSMAHTLNQRSASRFRRIVPWIFTRLLRRSQRLRAPARLERDPCPFGLGCPAAYALP